MDGDVDINVGKSIGAETCVGPMANCFVKVDPPYNLTFGHCYEPPPPPEQCSTQLVCLYRRQAGPRAFFGVWPNWNCLRTSYHILCISRASHQCETSYVWSGPRLQRKPFCTLDMQKVFHLCVFGDEFSAPPCSRKTWCRHRI